MHPETSLRKNVPLGAVEFNARTLFSPWLRQRCWRENGSALVRGANRASWRREAKICVSSRGHLWLNTGVNPPAPALSPATRLRLADDVTFQSLGPGEETVVLSLSSGYLYTCNETTAAFLRGLDGRQTLAAVIDRLFGEFQVSREQLERDMTELAGKLLEEKLLVEER